MDDHVVEFLERWSVSNGQHCDASLLALAVQFCLQATTIQYAKQRQEQQMARMIPAGSSMTCNEWSGTCLLLMIRPASRPIGDFGPRNSKFVKVIEGQECI